MAFLAGGRLTDEDSYALSKLARVAFGTNDVDHRRHAPADLPLEIEANQAAGMRVTNADVEHAKVVVVVGLDAEQEVPILHLRIRKAAGHGARVFVVHPGERGCTTWPSTCWSRPARRPRCWTAWAPRAIPRATPPGGSGLPWPRGGRRRRPRRRAAGRERGRRGGRGGAGGRFGGKFGLVPRRAGERGALRAGVHPRAAPRRAAGGLAGARGGRGGVGRRPAAAPGRDATAILTAAADREIDVLFLIGVDPLRDFPDAALASARSRTSG